jgi:hypothetical protein
LHDIDLHGFRATRDITFSLDLPDGYVPQDLKSHVQADSQWGSTDFTYDLQGNTLTGRAESTYTGDNVLLSDNAKFATFVKAIEDEGSTKFVLKKQ